MRKRISFSVLVAVLLATKCGIAAPVIRSATHVEMAALLAGCWTQQETSLDKRAAVLGYFNEHEMCFLTSDKVTMSSVGGNSEVVEGFDGGGSYEIKGGRLHLRSPEPHDGWLFSAEVLSCDVLMVPGREMKLYNCVDEEHAGDLAHEVPDSSWTLMQ